MFRCSFFSSVRFKSENRLDSTLFKVKRPVSKVRYFLPLFLTFNSRSVFVIFRFWLVAWCPTQLQLTPPISGSNHALWADNYRPVDPVVSSSFPPWLSCREELTMPGLLLGDEFPNFEADTTIGRIKFHEFLGDSWVRTLSDMLFVWTYSCNGGRFFRRIRSEFKWTLQIASHRSAPVVVKQQVTQAWPKF